MSMAVGVYVMASLSATLRQCTSPRARHPKATEGPQSLSANEGPACVLDTHTCSGASNSGTEQLSCYLGVRQVLAGKAHNLALRALAWAALNCVTAGPG